MTGFPVRHYLPGFAQIHVHWVGDTIQPSYSLPFPSPFALNLSQHQSLFQWVSSLRQVAKVLELHLQHQFFLWIFRVDFSGLTGFISLLSKGLSRVFSSTTIRKHQFFSAQASFAEGNDSPLQYSCLENPMDRGAWWAAVHGLLRVGHDWATSLSLFTFMHWRRKWQPTPVFLSGESQGRGSLVGCHLWGCTASDTTEAT